jgi:hypothetical protein
MMLNNDVEDKYKFYRKGLLKIHFLHFTALILLNY